MKIRKRLQVVSRVIDRPVQKKQVKAKATILTFNRTGSSAAITTTTSEEVTGYSRTHRPETTNEIIEQSLTNEAIRTEQNKEKPNLYGNRKKKLILTQKVIDKEQRRAPSNGWGNCAEAHAAYLIVNLLNRNNQFIESLFIDKATSVLDGHHDKERDARCKNCEQWCPPNAKKSAKLPKN